MDDIVLRTITMSAVLGTVGLLLGRWFRIPALLFFMVLGIIFGPSLLDIIQPDSMRSILMPFIEVAVAIIIFEAALALPLRSWKNAPKAIHRMLWVALPITGFGAFLGAFLIAGLSVPIAALYGSLIVVTGPTVIGPLLKSVALSSKVDSVLRWESIWADCIGVLISGIVLEIIISPSESELWVPLLFLLQLFVGLSTGILGGYLLGRVVLPWVSRLGDPALPGIVALTVAVGLFFFSNIIFGNSGILAVATAGIVTSLFPCTELEGIKHFKDQITTLIVAVLFVFLSAQLDLGNLNGRFLLLVTTASLLVFVVRPIASLVGLYRTSLTTGEKVFIGLTGPRGIIAAAVASYYAIVLGGMDLDAEQMHLLTFTTIFISGGMVSLLGKPMARWLRVSPVEHQTGIILIGGGPLSNRLAANLNRIVDVVVVDSDPRKCLSATEAGVKSRQGDALSDDLYEDLMEEGFRRVLIMTENSALNTLIAQKARIHLGNRGTFVMSWEPARPSRPSDGSFVAISGAGSSLREINEGLASGRYLVDRLRLKQSRKNEPLWPLAIETSDGVRLNGEGSGERNMAICLVTRKA